MATDHNPYQPPEIRSAPKRSRSTWGYFAAGLVLTLLLGGFILLEFFAAESAQVFPPPTPEPGPLPERE